MLLSNRWKLYRKREQDLNRITHLDYQFVDLVPETLLEGILYVSIRYAIAIHNCCCGCGNRVVTPLDPNQWELTFDGQSISLSPSIGNWNYPCRSHYWIYRGNVKWSESNVGKEVHTKGKRNLLHRLFEHSKYRAN